MSTNNIDKIIEIINKNKIKRDNKKSHNFEKDVFNIYFKNINEQFTFIDLMNLSDDLEECSIFSCYSEVSRNKGSHYLYSFYRLNSKYKDELKKKIEKRYVDNEIVFGFKSDITDMYYYYLCKFTRCDASKINEIKEDEELRNNVKDLINSLKENRINDDKDDVINKHVMSYAINRFIRYNFDKRFKNIENNETEYINVKKIYKSIERYDKLYRSTKGYFWVYPFYITDKNFINKISGIFDITRKNKNDGLVVFISEYNDFVIYFIKNCNNSNIYEIGPSFFISELLPNNIFIYYPPFFYDVYRYLRDKELNVDNVIETLDIYYKKYKKFVNEVFNYIEKKSDEICKSIIRDWNSDNKIKEINDKIFESNVYKNFEIIKALRF